MKNHFRKIKIFVLAKLKIKMIEHLCSHHTLSIEIWGH